MTAEEIHDLVRKSFTDDVEIAEVLWAARFSDATRQAERYRAGRILLAGDAAHLNFPANGQGLNLGLLDAVNLGWKLAAEIHGWAPAALLDSYSAEQHPVDARLLDITKAQVEFMFPDPDKEPLRRTITALLEIPEVKRYMAGLISGLDVRYPMDGPQHQLLGARMVDVKLSVDGGVRWFSELLHDGRGALVTMDERYAEAARRWLPRITVTEVAELPEVGAQAVLVRPDGYVCWVAEENGSAEDALRRLLVALTDWFGAREPSLSSGGKMTRPTLSGLHHVTFPVTDLDGATTWFETAFEAQRLPELDQHDEHGSRVAVVLRMPDVAPLVALRHTEGVPAATQVVQVGLGVADRAELTRWAAYFDGRGVAHSDIIVGPAGHVMTCTMPNGPALLLYAE